MLRLLAVLAAVVCLVLAAVAGHVIDQQSAPAPSLGLTAPTGPYPLHAVVFPATSRPLLNGVFTCYAQVPKKGAPYSNCRPYKAPAPTTTSTTLAPTTTVAPTTTLAPTTTTQAPTTTTQPTTTTTIPTVAVPASINATCSTDVTAQLASFINGVPSGSTVQFPSGGCYLVSNSASLTIQGTSGLTIDGNGATLEQTQYAGANAVVPVLSLIHDAGLTVSNLMAKGPSGTGNEYTEGDYGVMLRQDDGLTLDHVTIESVEGDGLALYAGYSGSGLNTNITVQNSTITDVGYHAITPESVNGFLFTHNTVIGGDIDAEVDFSCQATWPSCPGGLSYGVVGMHFIDNSFPNGFAFEDGISCLPIGDWSFTGNSFGKGYLEFQFPTSGNMPLSTLTTCGYPSGLTISNNTSGVSNEQGAWVDIEGWQNVQIDGNSFASPLEGAGASLCSVQTVQVQNNTFTNARTDVTVDTCHTGWPASTGVTVCGNTYGYNYPGPVVVKNDGACT